ncbi:MAG: c-type cytochrome [Sphingomonadaceae bacterium]
MPRIGNMALAAGCALAMSLAACSGGEEPAEEEEVAVETQTAETVTPAPAAAEAPPPDSTDTLDGTELANFTGDPEAGEQVFAQCRTCHVLEPGENRIGPSLHDIVGREAGQVEGFDYTPANAQSGIVWSREKLFQYLEDPHRVIPGTKMAFAGLKDPQDRADIIAFLETHTE